ncbi:L-histidine N(alpha)-methyltransferase [Mucilaginibacter sp. RS28]|uniref:L-histidine N(Alpha)-methyltransferase n=1 Tax=Mucilaginibacter straminoryzae TaxID=2932774 RepID=A0A9X2BDL0_9SPHI|nr:L-histidine N(alpha)-methyltransferase [Mucilaginibacter straminoryzae]MCJ8210438.1 L-histidine N(alpha)-methyltransferase [Mucilaginibacter straminoryzae]
MHSARPLSQTIENPELHRTQFCDDVLKGLKFEPKYLESKYFYDAKGDELFQQIMASPEYYPTDCEMEIFREQTGGLSKVIRDGSPFNLIELGAGDATKSIHLLRKLLEDKAEFTYLPIDISGHVIDLLHQTLPLQLPGLKVEGLEGDYFDALEKAEKYSDQRKVVLFLGSNIGNMPVPAAEAFCRQLREHLSPGDMVLMGFDLKKHPKIVLAAYNDAAGVTRQFNLNLLERINREIDGNFNLDQFEHYPTYDPETGACKSYLISLADQQVHVCGETINFKKDEYIFMEVSQKYSAAETRAMAKQAGFKVTSEFYDTKGWFLDTIWEAL